MVQGTKVLSFEGAAPLANPACVPQWSRSPAWTVYAAASAAL